MELSFFVWESGFVCLTSLYSPLVSYLSSFWDTL